MKQYKLLNGIGVLLTVCLAAQISFAQEKIEDEDLMQMLEQANTGDEVAPEAQPPVAEKEVPAEPEVSQEADADAEAVEEAAQEASTEPIEIEVEESSVEVEPAEVIEADFEDEMIDDIGMTTYDESVASSRDELISVRLNRVGLEEAITLFAQLSGANIIIPELAEAAQISVNLKDVEWRPALQSILDSYNYELYQKVSGSNVYSVRRRPEGAPEPQVVETFFLRYATVPNAAKLVRALLPEDAKISEFASRNMLVVKSTESSLSEVRSVLQTIDTVRQQVFIESKFMELSDGTQVDLGLDWKQLGLDETGAGGIGASVGPALQTYTDGRQLTALGPTDASIATPIDNFSDHIFTSVMDIDQFSLVLNALESDRGVDVVSNPKIIVANEETANISIVRREPNLKQERQQTAGAQGGASIDNTVFELDADMPFFDFGIKLDVTPSINTSSNITVNIKPSLTRKFGDKDAGQTKYPIIDEKSVQTVFNLTSGQTAAIGGLSEVTESEKERRVPLLGSIPLLGKLFSWKQTIHDQTETIIFVTVGLANTADVGLENGLPEDSELARRRLIRDENRRLLRDQKRRYYEALEEDQREDQIKVLDAKEAKRVRKRGEEPESNQA